MYGKENIFLLTKKAIIVFSYLKRIEYDIIGSEKTYIDMMVEYGLDCGENY